MAHDDEFIIGGRKSKKSASSQGTPRTTNPRGGGNQSGIKLGDLSGGSMNFTKRLARSAGDMAIAKRSSGRIFLFFVSVRVSDVSIQIKCPNLSGAYEKLPKLHPHISFSPAY